MLTYLFFSKIVNAKKSKEEFQRLIQSLYKATHLQDLWNTNGEFTIFANFWDGKIGKKRMEWYHTEFHYVLNLQKHHINLKEF